MLFRSVQNYMSYGPNDPRTQQYQSFVQNASQYLTDNGVDNATIQGYIQQGEQKGIQSFNDYQQYKSEGLTAGILPIAGIAAAYFLPGVGAALADALNVSTAVGNALASVAVQTAQGVPLDKAVQNAAISTVVQTGSTDVAQKLNTVLQDPKLANVITSVGASALKTAEIGRAHV